MKRTAATIFAVFLCVVLLAPALEWPSPRYAWGMVAVDFVALAIICWRPAGKWQSMIGATYAIQIAIHFGRIIVGENADMNAYWWGLSIAAILQLLLLGWWWISGLFPYRHRSRHCSQDIHPPDTLGVAR